MAQAPEEIARDLVVAWLSYNLVTHNANNPEQTGQAIGKIYQAVLQAVREENRSAAGISPEPEMETEPAPQRRRGGRR